MWMPKERPSLSTLSFFSTLSSTASARSLAESGEVPGLANRPFFDWNSGSLARLSWAMTRSMTAREVTTSSSLRTISGLTGASVAVVGSAWAMLSWLTPSMTMASATYFGLAVMA